MTGAVLSSQDAFLVLRGLKTLALRMERHCASAQVLAEWLAAQPQVAVVHYPGLSTFPQHALAQRHRLNRSRSRRVSVTPHRRRRLPVR